MPISAILLRTLAVYVALITTMRLMGKRQIGELEVTDLVTTLLLSEIAALPITDPDIPLLNAILPGNDYKFKTEEEVPEASTFKI